MIIITDLYFKYRIKLAKDVFSLLYVLNIFDQLNGIKTKLHLRIVSCIYRTLW